MVRVKEWLLVLFTKVKYSIMLSCMMSCYHRDVSVKAIENLIKKKEQKFDYVLLDWLILVSKLTLDLTILRSCDVLV